LELAKKSLVQRDSIREQLDRHALPDAKFLVPFINRFVDLSQPAMPDPRVQAMATGDQVPTRLHCSRFVS
jgi:hypothetical protein